MAETINELGNEPTAGAPLKMDTEPPEYSAENDSPPSYDSLFGKVKKAKDDSNGFVDFGCRVITMVFCGTICCVIWIVIMLALPVACIVLGVKYKDDCPRQKYIPIYLIVAGCFGALKSLINIFEKVCQWTRKNRGDDDGDDDDTTERKRPNPLDSLVSCFLLAWFIAGSVWVFSIYGDHQHDFPEQDNYCHKTLYAFSFWMLIAQYITVGLAICCCCGLCTLLFCLHLRSGSNSSSVV